MFENVVQLHKEVMQLHRWGSELPHGEFLMLKVIKRFADSENSAPDCAGVKMTLLSECLGITKSAVSQVMNSLEQKSLIERTMADNDRRIIYVKLTENGEKVLEKTREICWSRINEVIERLGDEDSFELNRILIKLYGILKDLKSKNSA
jgi:DNA-binding MarR family transcriptional regulator